MQREPVTSVLPPEPDAHCCPPFSNVMVAMDQINLNGPDQLSADSLRGDIAWLSGVQRAADAMSARWLAALDRREREAPPNLSSNCSSWLQDNLHLTHNAAYSLIRTSRQLERLPRTFAALRQGQINWQQVSVICRAMEEVTKTKLDPVQVESALVSAARQVDAQTLLTLWQQMRYQGDQEAGLEAEEEQRRNRWLRLWQTWKGSYRLEGELDPTPGSPRSLLRGVVRTPAVHLRSAAAGRDQLAAGVGHL